jgi:hypothetical protein
MPTKSILVNVMIVSTLFGLTLILFGCSSDKRKLANGKIIPESKLKTMYGGTPWYLNYDCAPDNPPACPLPYVGCGPGNAHCRFCSGAHSWICLYSGSWIPDFDGCTVTQENCNVQNNNRGWCDADLECRGFGGEFPPEYYPECGSHNVCDD